MKRVLVLVGVAVILAFGWVVVVPHLSGARGGGQAINISKYPVVPDEPDINNIVPDPQSDNGNVHVCVKVNDEQIGMRALYGADFAPGASPTWAKQAAIARATTDIMQSYNDSLASFGVDGDGTASAAYVKYCWDCGAGPNCCGWTCNGVWQQDSGQTFCVPYRGGNCAVIHYDCPAQGHTMQCGYCDYIDPP